MALKDSCIWAKGNSHSWRFVSATNNICLISFFQSVTVFKDMLYSLLCLLLNIMSFTCFSMSCLPTLLIWSVFSFHLKLLFSQGLVSPQCCSIVCEWPGSVAEHELASWVFCPGRTCTC